MVHIRKNLFALPLTAVQLSAVMSYRANTSAVKLPRSPRHGNQRQAHACEAFYFMISRQRIAKYIIVNSPRQGRRVMADLVAMESIAGKILVLRGLKIMLDRDLA